MSFSNTSFDLLGIPISITTLAQAQTTIEQWSKDTKGRFVCVRDVPSLMASIQDPNLVALHREAAMVAPDGVPLVKIGKLRGFPIERTCGPDLMETLCSHSPQSGLKHYFYGGKAGVAEKLTHLFRTKYPNICIVGYESPPFRPLTTDEDKAAVSRIKASGADVVWVGMSSPKQDVWMREHYQLLPQTLIGVGAAFDFHSGTVRRAPVWMQRNGLEWAHRLFSEPRRLWRRYLILAPKFVLLVCIEFLCSKTQLKNRAPNSNID